MKAYEMFEELGYECQYTKQCIYYRKTHLIKEDIDIIIVN